MHKTIAIIIPVRNSLEYTKKCLAVLENLTAKAVSNAWRYEVVVVDDGSDDGTEDWIRANHPAVHLCFGDGSLWWSGGINLGMRYVELFEKRVVFLFKRLFYSKYSLSLIYCKMPAIGFDLFF